MRDRRGRKANHLDSHHSRGSRQEATQAKRRRSMKLDFAICAHHATVDSDGMFSLLKGGIAIFEPVALPSTAQSFFLIARMSFSPEECEATHTCVSRLTSPSGKRLSHELAIEASPVNRGFLINPTITLSYGYSGLPLEEVGLHRFEICVGNNIFHAADFEVRTSNAGEKG